jgi:hypothetical protein
MTVTAADEAARITAENDRIRRVGQESQERLGLSKDYVGDALALEDGIARVWLANRARQGAQHYGLGAETQRALFLAALFNATDPRAGAARATAELAGTEERHLAALVCHLMLNPDTQSLSTMIFVDATHPAGTHATAWGRDLSRGPRI